MNVAVRKLKYRFHPPQRKRAGYSRQDKPHRRRGLCAVALLLALTIACLFAEKQLAPVIIETAAAKVNGRLTVLTNEAVTDTLRAQQISYSDLVDISQNEQGEIAALQTDVIKTNQLQSEIVLQLQNRLSEMNNTGIDVPAGVLTNIQMLAGYGFKIPAKLLSTELLKTELKDDFQSAGINQTKHKLWLEVSAKGIIGTGLHRQEITVVTQVPIAETVIVGTVPNFYANTGK